MGGHSEVRGTECFCSPPRGVELRSGLEKGMDDGPDVGGQNIRARGGGGQRKATQVTASSQSYSCACKPSDSSPPDPTQNSAASGAVWLTT